MKNLIPSFILFTVIAVILFVAKATHLIRFGKLADMAISFKGKREGAEYVLTINPVITNPTKKQKIIRQPYIRIFTKPKEARTSEDTPVAFSNISNTKHTLQPFESRAFDAITIRISPLSIIRIVREMNKTKKIALYVSSILEVDGQQIIKEKEFTPQGLIS